MPPYLFECYELKVLAFYDNNIRELNMFLNTFKYLNHFNIELRYQISSVFRHEKRKLLTTIKPSIMGCICIY